MAKYIYPAIFAKEGAFYNVRFPDLERCYTQGESLQDAYEMASDVLDAVSPRRGRGKHSPRLGTVCIQNG